MGWEIWTQIRDLRWGICFMLYCWCMVGIQVQRFEVWVKLAIGILDNCSEMCLDFETKICFDIMCACVWMCNEGRIRDKTPKEG